MATEFDKWDLKQAEWRGYALRALEDMNGEMKEIKEDINNIEKKLDKLNSRLTNTQVKLATLAGTVSLIVTIVSTIIINGIA